MREYLKSFPWISGLDSASVTVAGIPWPEEVCQRTASDNVTVIKVDFVNVFAEMACVGDDLFCAAQSAPPNMWPSGSPVWDSGINVGTFTPEIGATTDYYQDYPSLTKGDVTLEARCGSSFASRDVTFVKMTTFDETANNGDQNFAMGFSLLPSTLNLGVTPSATSDNADIVVSSVGASSVLLSIGDPTVYNDAGNLNALNGGTITITAGPCTKTANITVENSPPELISENVPGCVGIEDTTFFVTVADLETRASAIVHEELDLAAWQTFIIDATALISGAPLPPLTSYPSVQVTNDQLLSTGMAMLTCNVHYPILVQVYVTSVKIFDPLFEPGFNVEIKPTASGPDGEAIIKM